MSTVTIDSDGNGNHLKSDQQKLKRIALKMHDHFVLIEPEHILYCESDSNYTTFFLSDNQELMIAKTLKEVEHSLAEHDFFRIHASYLINMKHVSKFTRGSNAQVVMNNNKSISVSRKKKDEFFKMFSQL